MSRIKQIEEVIFRKYGRRPISGVIYLAPGPMPENCTRWHGIPDIPRSAVGKLAGPIHDQKGSTEGLSMRQSQTATWNESRLFGKKSHVRKVA